MMVAQWLAVVYSSCPAFVPNGWLTYWGGFMTPFTFMMGLKKLTAYFNMMENAM